jgi:hypothetical protein
MDKKLQGFKPQGVVCIKSNIRLEFNTSEKLILFLFRKKYRFYHPLNQRDSLEIYNLCAYLSLLSILK